MGDPFTGVARTPAFGLARSASNYSRHRGLGVEATAVHPIYSLAGKSQKDRRHVELTPRKP